jgi:hypothetical protein
MKFQGGYLLWGGYIKSVDGRGYKFVYYKSGYYRGEVLWRIYLLSVEVCTGFNASSA